MYGTDHAFVWQTRCDPVLETKIIVAAARSSPRWKRNILVAAVGGMLIRSANESVLETKTSLWQQSKSFSRLANKMTSGDWRPCCQRRLAHMPSTAIGGHYPDTPDSIHYFRPSYFTQLLNESRVSRVSGQFLIIFYFQKTQSIWQPSCQQESAVMRDRKMQPDHNVVQQIR